jgi:RNA polymerase sigma-70 factor, ECF subfamily
MGADLAELEQLYRDRYVHFVRVATAIVGNVDAGRDAVQAAFATAVRRRRSFRHSGPLEAWLWRILVNEARRELRSAARADAFVPEPASNGHPGDDGASIRAWVASLPDRQRAAVFLRHYADLDYATIADLLGVRVGTVSATLNAAHAHLRRQLEEVDR